MANPQHLSCYATQTIQGNEIYGENFTEPPPELVEGEEVYEVKTICGHRKQG